MDVNAVLSEAWTLYTRFFVRFVITAAAVFVVVDFVGTLAAQTGAGESAGAAAWQLLSAAVTLVGVIAVQGALVEAVRDVRDGRSGASVRELYARTSKRLPTLVGAGMLAGLAIGVALALPLALPLGFVLLVAAVPLALYLLTRWLFLVPAVVLERRSVRDAFRRSSELVEGNGWSVFGLMVLTLVAAALAFVVIGALLLWSPSFVARWVGLAAGHSLVTPFVVVAWTIGYYHVIGAGRALAADAS